MSSKFKPQSLHQKTHEKIEREGKKPEKPTLTPTWVKPQKKITAKDLEPVIQEQAPDRAREQLENTPPRSPNKLYSISSFEETEDLKELLKQTITICHQISTLHLETAKANFETANQVRSLTDSVNSLNDLFSKQLQEPLQVNSRITTSSILSRPKTPRYDTYKGDLNQTISLPVREGGRSKSISVVRKLK